MGEPHEMPKGTAIVERMGWDESGRFTATLVFKNGAPDNLSFMVIWKALPVRLVVADPEGEP